jgi:ABC-type amino acid transport substrate-binding protein
LQCGDRYEQRKAEVNFCTPHLRLQLALVVRKNAPDPLDAAKNRFGVRRGTTAEKFLREGLGLEPVRLSESNEELYNAVSNGQLDAITDDSPIAMHFASSIAGLSYRGAYDRTEGEYAIMVGRDNDALKCEIDAALSVLEAEGTLAMLRERWFGTPAVLIA